MSSRRSKFAAVLISASLALVVAGCTTPGTNGQSPSGSAAGGSATGGPAQAAGAIVVERNLQFVPDTVAVKAGDKVTFTNEDSATHDVSIGGTDLGLQSKGQSVTWTSTAAGNVSFQCLIHPSMVGTVTVR